MIDSPAQRTLNAFRLFKTADLTASQRFVCHILAALREFQQSGYDVAKLTDGQIIAIACGDLNAVRMSSSS